MGIIAKIWNIKSGSRNRSGADQITDSVNYITNPEKCDGHISGNSLEQVNRELHYVMNDLKTLQGLYVGGRHILDVKNATQEMMQIKEYYGKTDGRVALHGIISLDQEESDPKNAGKLMFLLDDLMEQVFPEHQVVYAVHTNTDNLHIHFIANTVGLDGRKIHMDKIFMRKVFEPALNRLAPKYGFTPNDKWVQNPVRDKYPIAERKMLLRKAVDLAVEESDDFDSLVEHLRKQGMTVNVGKHMSLWTSGMEKGMRTSQLGPNYTIESIQERLMKKRNPFEISQAGHYAGNIEGRELLTYIASPLQKYKDLGDDEKKRVIHELRIGKNPWRQRQQTNWQMERMAEEMKNISYIQGIARFYAPESGKITDAKEEIIRRQKELSKEKKRIRQSLRFYKPVTELYEEMKRYEKKAFLYEADHQPEYQPEYETYKALEERLLRNYSKTVEEVASYLDNQNDQMTYVMAQIQELSGQYKALLNYEKSLSITKREEEGPKSVFEVIGHSKARRDAISNNVYVSRSFLVVAAGNSQAALRVLTTPGMVDGKATVVTEVSLLQADGKILEKFSSAEMGMKEFNDAIYAVKKQYGFEKCYERKNWQEAEGFLREQGRKNVSLRMEK